MTVSYFVHLHGDPSLASGITSEATESLTAFAKDIAGRGTVVMHTPVPVESKDPLPVTQDSRLLLCQVCVADEAALGNIQDKMAASFQGIVRGKSVTAQSHAMSTEYLKSGSPDQRGAAATAYSFMVQYDGPAKNPDAFHAYYGRHHVPIVRRMPGIRSISYHVPTAASAPVCGVRVERLQIVQAVLDSTDAFFAMRNSAERKEGLRDFDNYPPFEGAVTHQIMTSRRLG